MNAPQTPAQLTPDTAAASDHFRVVGQRPIRPDGADKVQGRANFGADLRLPGMLTGRVLRSPHAHARILSIDTRAASALAGVKAVVTAADFPELGNESVEAGEGAATLRDLSHNCMARGKVLYVGHAVAAVAATSPEIAAQALERIEVRYEVLPHVIDVEAAMAADAPLLHDDLYTKGETPKPTAPSNIAEKVVIGRGDVAAALASADVVVRGRYTTEPVHQGYLEPHACVASSGADGQHMLWVSTQGHFAVRAMCAKLLGIELADLKVIPAEIGGGFGGKTTVYLEPLAVALSRKSGRPVKMQMSREDVFRATGPGSATRITVKVGAKRDGTLIAMDALMEYEAGAFKGSPAGAGAMTIFTAYAAAHQRAVALDIVVNKPKVAAYRAPGAPQAAHATECLLNELAAELGIDPLELRFRNATRNGTPTVYGATLRDIGLQECLEAARAHPHWSAPLAAHQGRGVAVGFWFNHGAQSSASVHLVEGGKILLQEGTPDIGGSRASMALMAADTLGIPYTDIHPIVADTASVGYNDMTGGSRVTYATGYAVVEACRDLIASLRARAAAVWGVDPARVEWKDGTATDIEDSTHVLGLSALAALSGRMEGPLSGQGAVNLKSAAPSFSVNIADVEVDPDTGASKVLRFTAIQDAGRAIHPDFVEGQLQGGAVQGIGWALNEEYRFDAKGVLENPGFLDYRMPVASDLPMIDTVIVEVPWPDHPFGVRGVGETPICAPMAAVASALNAAAGTAIRDLPLSPPRVLSAILAKG